jgi:putative aldouronate transport system permease protein
MISRSRGEQSFNVVNVAILSVVSITMLYPFVNVLAQSFSSNMAIVRGEVFVWPVRPTLYGYQEIFRQTIIFRSLGNTIFVTIVGTFLGLFLTSTCAYALSRRELLGHKYIFFFYLFTMLFNGGLIPTYLIVRGLGLLNTIWAMILPQAFMAYYMILMKNFFEAISQDVQDAAIIDGCNDFVMYLRIMLPLSKPMLATLGLYIAVIKWNAFTPALFFISDQKLYPIQIILRQLVFQSQFIETAAGAQSMAQVAELAETAGGETVSAAVVIFASIPIIMVYPFLQRHFVKGIMLGSVKG